MKKVYQLETVTCPSCIAKIESVLNKLEGIELAEVAFNSSRVKVLFDEKKVSSLKIVDTITKLGYVVLNEK